jgi:Smg protein
MSETVLDVLMYLFETYSEQDLEVEPEPDQSILREELLHAGFGEPEVDRALDWLDGLSSRHLPPFSNQPAERSIRLFNPFELSRLDADCRGYILYLEQIGILSTVQRELVIDRLVALLHPPLSTPGHCGVQRQRQAILEFEFKGPSGERTAQQQVG